MDEDKEMNVSALEALSQLLGSVDQLEKPSPQGDADLTITTLTDAMILLKTHLGPGDGLYRQKIVAGLINNDVRDLPERYHNFITSLSRRGEHRLIIQLCDYILSYAPHDRDILADAIDACGDLCNWDLGLKYLSKAQVIPKTRWNDKLFLSSGLFLKSRYNAYPDNEAYFDEAIKLSEDFIHYMQYDEHGYHMKAALYVAAQRRQEAIDFLLDVIRNGYSSNEIKTEKTRIVATQCCMQLLDLLDDSCDYDLIIEICDKGLRYTHEQVSARIASFAYRRALAYDAKAYVDGFRQETITAALAEIQSAYTLVTNDGSVADEDKILEQKYEALRRYAGMEFVPLKRRPLTIEDA